MTWFSLESDRQNTIPEKNLSNHICKNTIPEMASQISPTCDFVFGFLQCNLPEDTIDIDLKVCTIRGIYIYKEDCNTCTNKFRSWEIHVTLLKPLKEKMAKFMRQKEAATTTAAAAAAPTPSYSYTQQP